MYAEKLSPLIRKFPQDAEALRRMEKFLEDFEARRAGDLFRIRLSSARMFDILQAGSISRLSRVITILLEGEVFRRQLLVRVPSGGGITFSSYAELPEVVRDPVKDIEVFVTEENIEPSYILVTNAPR
ncbi:hypothetical protein ACSX1C_16670 [Pseudomonas sp. MBLB4123]|uniref:hypothetical protein n=1 Tax=Pseudomonas sp. MBLB4123 TaxID=3451557 RepID=UPI003F74F91C